MMSLSKVRCLLVHTIGVSIPARVGYSSTQFFFRINKIILHPVIRRYSLDYGKGTCGDFYSLNDVEFCPEVMGWEGTNTVLNY